MISSMSREKRYCAVYRCSPAVSLSAAVAVAGDVPGSPIIDYIADLVGKSMIVADLRSEAPTYRLLDTTRLYALEKLRSAGEQHAAAERHARYYRNLSVVAVER